MISIIVPVYNTDQYLNRCVDSIINQTYKNLEIILVDDGSTDNSGKICDEYKKKDSRIIVIHKTNGGMSSARNAGLDIATGNYIAFVDSDDYIAVNMMDTMRTYIIDNDVDMAVCGYTSLTENKILLECGKAVISGIYNPEKLFESETAHIDGIKDRVSLYTESLTNKLYKRYIFDDLRLKIGKNHEDFYLMHYIIIKCKKVYLSNDLLYFYWYNPNSVTSIKYNITRLDAVEAHLDRIKLLDKAGLHDRIGFYLYSAINILTSGYNLLDKKDKLVKQRIKELKTGILYSYKKHCNKMCLKYRICAILFKYAFPVYAYIRKKTIK